MGRGNGATGEHIDKATVIAQRLLETLNGMTFDVPDTSKAETAAADAVSQHVRAPPSPRSSSPPALPPLHTADRGSCTHQRRGCGCNGGSAFSPCDSHTWGSAHDGWGNRFKPSRRRTGGSRTDSPQSKRETLLCRPTPPR